MKTSSSRSQSGLTLVETLSAILIFSLVTLGTIPLLAGALRGSSLVRTNTVGKNLGVEAMERARGLPYYLSEARDPGDVDLLDLYFPDQPTSGNSYVTVCESDDVSAACPAGQIADGYRLTYTATFVNVDGDEVDPRDSYDAHPDQTGESDDPPRSLLRLRVRVSWRLLGDERDFVLESLFSERKFGDDRMRGRAALDYVVNVSTTYESGTDETSLVATGGTGESTIQSRTTTVASESLSAASISTTLGAGEPEVATGTVAELEAPPHDGDAASAGFPSNVNPSPVIVGAIQAADLDGAQFWGPPSSQTTAVHVGALPEYGRGGFLFPSSSTVVGNLWVDKNVVRSAAPYRFAVDTKLVRVGPDTSGNAPLRGYTSANAEAANATGLTTSAHGSFARLRLLPTTFAPGGVVTLRDFTATVSCNARSFGAATNPSATWSFSVAVSIDAAEGGTAQGELVIGPITEASAQDPLAAYRPAPETATSRDPRNPMVYEDPTNTAEFSSGSDRSAPADVYLFPQRHVHSPTVTHQHAGYLESWQSRVGVSTRIGGDDDPASATIDKVIGISTQRLPTATGATTAPLFVSVGSMSCEAVDQR